MSFEELVPPPELCKKIGEIPIKEVLERDRKGHFAECFFVWVEAIPPEEIGGVLGFYVVPFNQIPAVWDEDYLHFYPAPTLKEILRDIQPGDVGVFCSHEGDGKWNIGDCECDLYVKNGYGGENPEALALRWWFEQKGIEA